MPVDTNVHECIHHYMYTMYTCIHVYTGGRTAQMNLVEHWTKKAIHKTDTCAALIPQYDYEYACMAKDFSPRVNFHF